MIYNSALYHDDYQNIDEEKRIVEKVNGGCPRIYIFETKPP